MTEYQKQNFIGGLVGSILLKKGVEVAVERGMKALAKDKAVSLQPKDVREATAVVTQSVTKEVVDQVKHATNTEPAYQSRVAQGSSAAVLMAVATDLAVLDRWHRSRAARIHAACPGGRRRALGALRALHRQEAVRGLTLDAILAFLGLKGPIVAAGFAGGLLRALSRKRYKLREMFVSPTCGALAAGYLTESTLYYVRVIGFDVHPNDQVATNAAAFWAMWPP